MECYALSFFSAPKPLSVTSSGGSSFSCRSNLKKNRTQHVCLEAEAGIYKKFVQFALDETKRRTNLLPSPLQNDFNSMTALDGNTELRMLSFHAPKIRLLRCMSIEQSKQMQVLDLAVFPTPEYDLPIFCANFYTAFDWNIIVLDLNPLHDVITQSGYKEKYYTRLMHLGLQYAKLFPWGGKLTSESIRFFSPIVIWTKFTSTPYKQDVLYGAFKDYYMAWLELMDQAMGDYDASQISFNSESQHRYLTWRAQKDPGHQVLKRLIGETCAKDLLRRYLFNGVDEMGSKTFLDYFPDYQNEDGTINEKRSILGKSFERRPWDAKGEFIGDAFK